MNVVWTPGSGNHLDRQLLEPSGAVADLVPLGSTTTGISLTRVASHSLRPLDLSRGLTLEYWARIPLTARLWEEFHIGLHNLPPDSFQLGPGGPIRGDKAKLGMVVPSQEDVQGTRWASLHATGGGGDNVPLPQRLRDGGWHRYRWVIYPSGELHTFADGIELFKSVRADLNPFRKATLSIAGRSVKTLGIVDDISIWSGVVLDDLPTQTRLRGR